MYALSYWVYHLARMFWWCIDQDKSLAGANRPAKWGEGMQLRIIMPVEKVKCWWLLKIEPSISLKPAQTPSKMGQYLYNSPKNSRVPIAWRSTQTAQLPLPPAHAFGSIFSNHQHFAVSTGICGVACPLPASRVDKPLSLARVIPRSLWLLTVAVAPFTEF